jgi:hypothetical protein
MPVSKKQLAANRANAKKSTGPRTPEGKARSAFNNLRHGLYSDRPLLPHEDHDAFRDFAIPVYLDLNPAPGVERALVRNIVDLAWRLRRVGPAASPAVASPLRGTPPGRLPPRRRPPPPPRGRPRALPYLPRHPPARRSRRPRPRPFRSRRGFVRIEPGKWLRPVRNPLHGRPPPRARPPSQPSG